MPPRPVADLDGTWWTSSGRGPVVVVPRLNVDWTQVDLSPLTDRFRVVIVAPRGFGPSERPGQYDGDGLVADVLAVLDHLGVTAYATFGYSMNGVMAGLLARADPRVVAVAAGGFPLTAELSGMGDRARARNGAARADSGQWAEVLATYDPRAAEAFWDHVAALPRGAVADLGCPIRAWWGDADTVLGSMQDPSETARELTARGVAHDVLSGLDHDGALARLDLVLPTIVGWLTDEFATTRRR